MEARPRSSGDSYVAFALKAGAFNALLVTGLSALAIPLSLTLITRSFPNVLEILKNALLVSPITAVSFGPYGLLAGMVWSRWVYHRKHLIRTNRRLLLESAILGFVFGILFPFFDGLLYLRPLNDFRIWLSPMGVLLCWILSVTCALTCALFFRKSALAGL
ncbi:MAG: hypothetical protein JWO13_63 [Acidobacteriales bacterium]|nr:hypothetical protein [Terriglobales bacterium]